MPYPIIDFRASLMAGVCTGGQGDPGRMVWEEMRVRLDLMGLVIRTDFSDQLAWEEVQIRLWAGLEELGNDFPGSILNGDLGLLIFDDERYAGLTADQAASLVEEVKVDMHEVIFLADNVTMTSAEKILLAVGSKENAISDFGEDDGSRKWNFRIRPESVARVYLGITRSTSFGEHFEEVDDNGIYRY